MGAVDRAKLRELIRVGRFNNWSVDKLEDEIVKLFGGEVDDQPVTTPDQPPPPPPA